MTKRQKTLDERRLGQEQWERAAMAALAEGGIDAVAVEPLARQLGVTKGSFYWHFKDRNALLAAALERWEKVHTEAVITLLRETKDARARLTQLLTGALAEPLAKIHLALGAAAAHPVVGPVLSRVTARRVAYLVECFRELGFSEEIARHRALLAYAAYVGFLHFQHEAPEMAPRGKPRGRYTEHVIATLLSSPSENG